MDIKPPKRRRRVPTLQPRQQKAKAVSPQPIKPYKKKIKNGLNQVLNDPRLNSGMSEVRKKFYSSKPRFVSKFNKNKPVFLSIIILFVFAAGLHLYKLASLPPKSFLDSSIYLKIQSINHIISDISYAPLKLIDYVLFKAGLANALSFRLVSATVGLATVIIFFILIKRWMGHQTAWLASILFSSSTLVLAISRTADFYSLFLLVIPLLFLLCSLIKSSPHSKWIIPLACGASLMLYVPGFIWLFLAASLVFSSYIIKLVKSYTLKLNALLFAALALPVMPLIFFLSDQTASFKLWLGLPSEFSVGSINVLSNLAAYFNAIFYSGLSNILIWQPGTPIIDGATIILMLAGLIYVAKSKIHKTRKLTMVLFFIISSLFIILLSDIFLITLLPLIYIFAAYGILYLMKLWYFVFPTNPLAKNIGFSMLVLLVGFISFYHASKYFIVWPRNDNVKEAFDKASSDTIDSRANNNFRIIGGE